MYRVLLLLILFLLSIGVSGQLIVNEFSQGSGGSKEYIEFVVTGTRTCKDSTADLRRWIIDDQNGWFGGSGNSRGHFRFAPVASWAKVPYGSIIVLYNKADKNSSLILPDDPSDANGDKHYIVPHNSTVMEVHNNLPAPPYSSVFTYPVNGYVQPVLNDWSRRMGLNNNLDALIIVAPSSLTAAYFSLTYGLTTSNPPSYPAVRLPASVPVSRNCYLVNDSFQVAANWRIGIVPNAETPGLPNTAANKDWITKMGMHPLSGVASYQTACIASGDTFDFSGLLLTAGGQYVSTYITSAGCDSTVHLYLTVSRTERDTAKGCAPVLYAGVYYSKDSSFSDTLRSALSLCDSIYRITQIIVRPPPQVITAGGIFICRGTSTLLSASAANCTYYWSGGTTGPTLLVQPDTTTTYWVIAIDEDGCADSGFVTVTVEDFQLQLSANVTLAPAGTRVHLRVDAAFPFEVFGWNPFDLFANSRNQTQVHVLRAPVVVSVWGKSVAGCTDTASLELQTLQSRLDIPSAFTPNSDGRNDVFQVSSTALRDMQLKLYNRWGTLVFETGLENKGWDGKCRNVPQPSGTYVYYLTAQMLDGSKITKKGSFLLLR